MILDLSIELKDEKFTGESASPVHCQHCHERFALIRAGTIHFLMAAIMQGALLLSTSEFGALFSTANRKPMTAIVFWWFNFHSK